MKILDQGDANTMQCGRRDSNPQGLRHTLLRRTCIPIPSLPHTLETAQK